MKKVIVLLALLVSFAGCKKDDKDEQLSPPDQAKVDDQKIVEYLETHKLVMLGDVDEWANNINWKIEEISEDEPEDTETLMDLMGENIITHNMNDVDYKIYYYVVSEGDGETPGEEDEMDMEYSGFHLTSTSPFQSTGESLYHIKLKLNTLVVGMKEGIPIFKTGAKPEVFPGELGEDFKIDPYRENIINPGRGFLIMPSGVAYGPNGSSGIYPNSVLRFDIVLYDSEAPAVEEED